MRGLRRGLLGGAAILGLAMPAAGQGQGQVPDVRLDAITVEAGKREQRLGEIDGAVAVRTAADLEEARVTRVEDLEKVFPGLLIRTRGNRAYAGVTLRGVTSPDFYNPAVQVYVDGVPQDASYFTQEMANVERVELLRGPQGTLYGRNAHGGVINIITRRPGNRLEGEIGGTLSTLRRSADARIATPIIPGALFGEVSVRTAYEAGEVRDLSTDRNDFDDASARLARVKLRFAPTGSPLDITASAQHERLRSHEELYIRDAQLHSREFETATQSAGVDPMLDRKVNTYSLSASYDFGPAKLTSVSSYQDRRMARIVSGRNTPENQDTVAQEVRLSFDLGRSWSGVIGGFFQDSDFDRRVPGASPSVNRVDQRSYALFGEATWKITDTVDLTAGARWSREEAGIDFVRSGASPFAFKSEDSFDDVSPKLALGWQVTPEHRVYALAQRGFKPGGFNHTVSNLGDSIAYSSETSTNLETGWRGRLLDGRLEVGAAAYWINAQDKQIYVGPLGQQVLRNVGDARSYGVEADIRYRPVDGLTIGLGATIGRSTFVDARDPQTGADYDGNRVPYAPDQTYQLSVRYVVPGVGLPGELSLRGAARYFSRIYFEETNTLKQGGYAVFDLGIDLQLDSGFGITLFADNLTDRVYRTSSFSFGPGDNRSTIADGRTIGVAGRYSF
ncbi:TonB-dependent receptor [Allostella vacuolata]|nr:TonB-dependent receptor [Stella vacuolata]